TFDFRLYGCPSCTLFVKGGAFRFSTLASHSSVTCPDEGGPLAPLLFLTIRASASNPSRPSAGRRVPSSPRPVRPTLPALSSHPDNSSSRTQSPSRVSPDRSI